MNLSIEEIKNRESLGYFFCLWIFLKVKLIEDNFLFADGTIFLFDKPVLNTIAMMNMFTLENGDILTFIDLIIAYTANLFRNGFLFGLWVLWLFFSLEGQLLTGVLGFGQESQLYFVESSRYDAHLLL